MTSKLENKAPLIQKQYGITDIETIFGFNRLTARRRWEKGLFPKPTKIGNRLFWSAESIDRWLAENLGVKHG